MNIFLKRVCTVLILILFLIIFLEVDVYANETTDIFLKYPKLFKNISKLKNGNTIDLDDINIKIESIEEHYSNKPGVYYLLYPRDIDIKPTDKPPYNKKHPYLHLNLPLLLDNSPTNFLIMSDQPESISEENLYLEYNINGIDGIYAKSTALAGKRVRFLADHFNKSKETKWVKVFLTAKEDAKLIIHKKGEAIDSDSVAAGTVAEVISHQIQLADHRTILAKTPALLGEFGPVGSGQTIVIWYEMTFSKDTCISTIVTDKDKLITPTEEELENLPKLKSLKWKDKEEQLKTLVDSTIFPSRYYRVLDSFIHARGIFPNPDRYCKAIYDYAKNPQWIQVYSTFEYIDGQDELTIDGIPVKTNNRGNYGSYTRMNIKIKSLPKGVDEIAVLAVNNSNTMGGMFKTTLDNKVGTFFIFDKTSNIVKANKAVLLWKGKVKKNSILDINFFALANTSVRIWYLLIPI